MYVCMYVRMYIQVSVPVCMYVRMHACMNVFMYALCAYVCIENSSSGSTVALCPSQARVQKEGWWRGADTAAVKNRLMKSNGRGRRVNGKHPAVEGEGKGVGHQHGRKPRIPEPVSIARKLA